MTTDYLSIQPKADEYFEYYSRYISLVPAGNIVELLRTQIADTLDLLGRLTEEKSLYKPGPNEWSIKEVIGHVMDTERIFAYRALRFARNDKTPIPGFDQDIYVQGATFDTYPLADLIEEFTLTRQTTVLLFKPLTPEMWTRRGTASDNEVSVRALAFIIAGHERHHLESLRTSYGLK